MNTVCDFCGDSNPKYLYPCKDFLFAIEQDTGTPIFSHGAWAACESCSHYIEKNYLKRLVTRVLKKKGIKDKEKIKTTGPKRCYKN